MENVIKVYEEKDGLIGGGVRSLVTKCMEKLLDFPGNRHNGKVFVVGCEVRFREHNRREKDGALAKKAFKWGKC